MMHHIEFGISGVSPLLCHNGQLADANCLYAMRIKEITAKRKGKTEADILEMQKCEFLGGLYMNNDHRPIIPGGNIEAMLTDAARKTSKGKAAEAGIVCSEDSLIIYEGPKKAETLWENKAFIDRRAVVIPSSKSRIMRVRPMFRKWNLMFTVGYDDGFLDEKQVVDFVKTAERMGLGDYTPKFGRFTTTSWKAVEHG